MQLYTFANIKARAAGDRVFFAGGQTFAGKIIADNRLGTALNPIVFSSGGSGRALIDGTDSCFSCHNGGGITISDLDFFSATGSGITFYVDSAGGKPPRGVLRRQSRRHWPTA